MELKLFEDKKFESIDYTGKTFVLGEYADCVFTNCDLSSVDLKQCEFMDCSFISCNLSLIQIEKTALKNIKFSNCKIIGVDFSLCDDFLFSVRFENCSLDYAVFYRKKMKKTVFADCSLKQVDFSETDLSMSVFKNCNLLNATFLQTNLEKADLRTAYNYAFDPEKSSIKKAKFSLHNISGLLTKYDIEIE